MMLFLRALPIWQQLTGLLIVGGIVAAGYGIWHHKVYRAGYDAALEQIAADNQRTKDAVDDNLKRVRDCDARDGMQWNQATRECERSL